MASEEDAAALLPEEAALELEALHATFGEAISLRCTPGPLPAAQVVASVAPRGDSTPFVAASLVLTIPGEYPSSSAEVALEGVKGMGDARAARVLAALRTDAAALEGDMMLGTLVDKALDLLTEANCAEGDCVFCLEAMRLGGGQAAAAGGAAEGVAGLAAAPAAAEEPASHPAYPVLRLECYHCFHMSCFGAWWHWQQAKLAAREAQLRAEYKAIADGKLREESIESDGAGVYTVRCPACRVPVPPASLAHAWDALQAARAEVWSAGGGARVRLTDADLARLRGMQRRHAAVLSRQRAAGALVEENVAVSLSELQLTAEASRQQQRQQAAAAAAAAVAAPARMPAASEQQGGQQRGPSDSGRRRGSQHRRGRGRGHAGGGGNNTDNLAAGDQAAVAPAAHGTPGGSTPAARKPTGRSGHDGRSSKPRPPAPAGAAAASTQAAGASVPGNSASAQEPQGVQGRGRRGGSRSSRSGAGRGAGRASPRQGGPPSSAGSRPGPVV